MLRNGVYISHCVTIIARNDPNPKLEARTCNPDPWSVTIFMLGRAWETVPVFIFYICVSIFQLRKKIL